MRHIKKNMVIKIGSALDNDKAWSSDTKKKIKEILKDKKEPNEHSIVFKMEKRRGKPVSIIGPFFIAEKEMKELCKKLKKKLGSGGTCKEEWMEFQGECRDKLKELITKEGFRTKS
jgi:translation initiation factor 1